MQAGSVGLDYLLSQLLYVAPLLVAYFVGLAVCAAKYRRHRRAATLAGAAFVVLFVSGLATPVINAVLLDHSSGNPVASVPYMRIVGVTSVILKAASVVVLAVAVFVGRGRPADDE